MGVGTGSVAVWEREVLCFCGASTVVVAGESVGAVVERLPVWE